MSERVYWNEIEKQKLCETAFGIFTNNPEESLVACINKAMEMMPPYRRRKIVTLSSIPWLLDYVKLKMQELKNYRKKVIASEPPPLPTTEELLRKATTQLDNPSNSWVSIQAHAVVAYRKMQEDEDRKLFDTIWEALDDEAQQMLFDLLTKKEFDDKTKRELLKNGNFYFWDC